MSFKDLTLPDNLINALRKQNITDPTDIQKKSFKPISEKKDFIGISSTGSGKTLAYLLPVITDIKADNELQKLIIVPTQELAVQINKQIELLIKNAALTLKSLFVIGEGNIHRQIDSLKIKPNIVVGTPSRILQLIKMKKLHVHNVNTVILDEYDKLLEKSYYDSIISIRKSLMKYIQIIMFSASSDKKSETKALSFINNPDNKPVIVNISNSNDKSLIPATIKHMYIITDRRERIETLRKIVKAVKPEKAIIFINTRYDLEESLQKLLYHKYNIASIAGNYTSIQKKNAIENFRKGKINYLLATDIAARGLQIDNIDTVINVNLPEEAKEYLHRSGRCGRNGSKGVCISIITENEMNKIKKYRKDFNINFIQRKLYNGKLVAK